MPAAIMRPYLAVAATDEDVAAVLRAKGTMWGFAKIDGVRCLPRFMWSDRLNSKICRVMSRSMKLFPNENIHEVLGLPELAGCDGELTVTAPYDPRACRSAAAAVATMKGEFPWRYYVFDRHDMPANVPYHERYAAIPELDPMTGARKLGFELISSVKEFRALERELVEKQGYEGLILRDPNGLYKEGRSTLREGGMLKIKRFVDAEAEIVGFEEEMANTNDLGTDERGYAKRSSAKAGMVGKGTLGAFICRDLTTGIEFSVGGGFTADERMLFWASRVTLKGKTITYKHLPTGVKDKPRHTGFVSFREAFDMDPVRLDIMLPADVRDLI